MSVQAQTESERRKSSVLRRRPLKPFLYVVVFVAAMGGLLFGFDMGCSGATFVMESFRKMFHWPPTECCDPPTSSAVKPGHYCMRYGCAKPERDCLEANTVHMDMTYRQCEPGAWEITPHYVADEQGWITSQFSIGGVLGALPSGTMADKMGRKMTLIVNAFIFLVGVVIQASCSDIAILYVGRLVSGFGVGVLSNVVTMYQSEMAPEHARGLLVAMEQQFITIGIAMAALMSVGLVWWSHGWRFSYSTNGLFAIFMICCSLWLPDSPRWLVQKERYSDAQHCLQKVRYDDEWGPELQSITKSVEADRNMGEGDWNMCFTNRNNMLYRTGLGCALQFFQQLTGINVIMFFAPPIIETFLGHHGSLYGNLIIQVVNCLSTLICIFYIDKVGRITLLLVGGVGMVIGLATITLLSSPLFDYKTSHVLQGLIIFFCCFYVFNFAFSWGPIAWVMCSEIFPQNLRGKCMSLTTMTNWTMVTVVGKAVPFMYQPYAWNLWGTFLFFMCWCVVMTVFVYMFVPETSNILLEDMDQLFHEFKFGFRRQKTSLNKTTYF